MLAFSLSSVSSIDEVKWHDGTLARLCVFVHQQSKPHVVAHVQLPKTEAEFDNILGFCLGQNHWCEYIEGDLSFLCVIAGFNAEELTPKYPDFISERVYALSDATRWWHEYGKEVLLLNNV